MTRSIRLMLLLGAALAIGAQQPAAREDPVLGAMSDELGRARGLRLVSLEVPYYVEYAVHEFESLSMDATLGAVSDVQKSHMRLPRVQVRVGDYKFDNGNYIYSDYTTGTGYDLGAFPLDNDYAAMRQYLWLATDIYYKSALEILARKQAALRNVTVTDQPPDFWKTEPVTMVLPASKKAVDEGVWRSRLRNVSAVFASHPQIIASAADFQVSQGSFYLANSEGTRVRVPEGSAHFQIRASALAADGMTLRDAASFHALDLGDLPGEAELLRAARGVADNLDALLRAPAGEACTGPVMFEPEAAAQLMAEVLGRNFALRRRPVSDPGRQIPFVDSELEGRVGSRVLPEWMDVVDDPTLTQYGGRPLLGFYRIDLEGVVPRPLVLVEKGQLKNYLLTRQPIRGLEGSTGRARLLGGFGANAATFSNLLVRAAETSTLDDLKKKLLDLCRQRNKPYGLLVRKMEFPSSASRADAQRLLASMAQDGAASRVVSLPTLIYRVYAEDGREELVRGLRFKDLSIRSFRDIVAAGGEAALFNYLENGAPFALMGAGSYVAESSVISPGVLFDELQVVRSQQDLPKLPIVAPPPLGAAR